MTKKQSIVTICIATLLIVCVTISASYAYWRQTLVQTGTNELTTGCFNISLTDEENEINLQKAFPISDEAGRQLTPFTFKVTNTCDTASAYTVNLEMLAGTTLGTQFVDVLVNDGEIRKLSTLPAGTKNESTSVESRSIDSGVLKQNESKEFSIRLWLDKDVTLEDDTQNKVLKAKVVITSEATEIAIQEELFDFDEVLADGECGEFCRWKVNEAGDTIIFYGIKEDGTGALQMGYNTWRPYDGIDNMYIRNLSLENTILSGTSFKTIIIEEGITSIGNYAFQGVQSESVKIPNSVLNIGNSAFSSTKLVNIDLGTGVQYLGDTVFLASSMIREIYLPDSLIDIGDQLFLACENLEEVYMGSKNTGTNTFYYLKNLKKVILSDNVEVIGNAAFTNSSVEEVVFGKNLKEIGENAFRYNKQLKELNIPQSVRKIGEYAFYMCEGIEGEIIIPEGITEIETNAFNWVSKVSSITIPSTVKKIDIAAFSGCFEADITIPDTVEIVVGDAFNGVKHITYHGNLDYSKWMAKSIN